MKKPFSSVLLLGIACTLGTLSQPVLAHEDGACKADVQKFCGDVKPGGGAIKDCMQSHSADLSEGCKENMSEGKEKMKERMEEVKAACAQDIKQFCANVTPGEGREMACLKSYSDKISAGCKEKLPKRGMHHGKHMHHDKDKDGDDKGDEGHEN